MIKTCALFLFLTSFAWAGKEVPVGQFNTHLSSGSSSVPGSSSHIANGLMAGTPRPENPGRALTQQMEQLQTQHARAVQETAQACREFRRQENQLKEPPVSSSQIASTLLKKKSSDSLEQLEHRFPQNESIHQLNQSIQAWEGRTTLEQFQVIQLTNRYAAFGEKLVDAPRNDFSSYSQIAFESGLDSLSQAAQSTDNPELFQEHSQSSQSALEIAKGLLDLGMGLTPGVSVGKDAYEAFTGKSLIDGSDLDLTSRSFAVLGVATAGGSNVIKGACKGLIKLGQLYHARGMLKPGFQSALHLAESGITDIVRHTPVHPGPLHSKEIINSMTFMKNESDTFRSATYYSYKTTQPITLYRVASTTFQNPEALLKLETTTAHHSHFWTRFKPTSPTEAMIDSALDRSWGSRANVWAQIEVPAGETLYEGVTASLQRSGNMISEFIGGGNQVYMNRLVPHSWVKEVGRF